MTANNIDNDEIDIFIRECLVSPEAGPAVMTANNIDNDEIDIFIRECRSWQGIGTTTIAETQ